MPTGIPYKEIPVVITNLKRLGNKGWSFDVIYNQGRPGEYARSYRTSTSGRGLELLRREAVPAEHKYGMDFAARPEVWRQVPWLHKDYKWPLDIKGMKKQLRIFFKSAVRIDLRYMK